MVYLPFLHPGQKPLWSKAGTLLQVRTDITKQPKHQLLKITGQNSFFLFLKENIGNLKKNENETSN